MRAPFLDIVSATVSEIVSDTIEYPVRDNRDNKRVTERVYICIAICISKGAGAWDWAGTWDWIGA